MPHNVCKSAILPIGEAARSKDATVRTVEVIDAGIGEPFLGGSNVASLDLSRVAGSSGNVDGCRVDAIQSPTVRAAVTPRLAADNKPGRWNRIVLSLRGYRLAVTPNGHSVLADARPPGLATRGRIGLRAEGSPIDFAILLGRDLSAGTLADAGGSFRNASPPATR